MHQCLVIGIIAANLKGGSVARRNTDICCSIRSGACLVVICLVPFSSGGWTAQENTRRDRCERKSGVYLISSMVGHVLGRRSGFLISRAAADIDGICADCEVFFLTELCISILPFQSMDTVQSHEIALSNSSAPRDDYAHGHVLPHILDIYSFPRFVKPASANL